MILPSHSGWCAQLIYAAQCAQGQVALMMKLLLAVGFDPGISHHRQSCYQNRLCLVGMHYTVRLRSCYIMVIIVHGDLLQRSCCCAVGQVIMKTDKLCAAVQQLQTVQT